MLLLYWILYQKLLYNRERYKISGKNAGKSYDEAYYEAEYEYCGYEEDPYIDNIKEDIDRIETIDFDIKRSVEDDDIMI